MTEENVFEKVVSLCKRRGFFFPSAEIYGGMNGVWDKGPLGTVFARNIENYWTRFMEKNSEYPLLIMDGAILGSHAMWKASGHVDGFHDPLVDCLNCNVRYRADDIDLDQGCEKCGNYKWGNIRQFNMMFKTQLGALETSENYCFLRPETAQTIFVQFKNIMSTNRVKIPFGVMQIGKAFRNEITPKQFVFRSREFSQMEMEFFCHPDDGWKMYGYWVNLRYQFYLNLGFTSDSIRISQHKPEDLSHYSKATSDIEYLYPFGWKEIEGIAYRTDFDLNSHMQHSKKNLTIYDEKSNQSYTPHVVESSVGVERLMLILLCHAYKEEINEEENDTRIYLALPFQIAPYQIAIFPLSKNEYALGREVYSLLIDQGYRVFFDDSGSIGKRYRRQDEIGTPYCITIDQVSSIDNTITIRLRDNKKQIRIPMKDLTDYFQKNT
jgi:glycyl-tRNA synthetase